MVSVDLCRCCCRCGPSTLFQSELMSRHTSVVAYGREVFFGQGILEARPGTTHHGPPMQKIDCGRTEIDESTFNEYIASLQEMYTPEAYHLIEFNCNHFTADVIGFLTGAKIPAWISGMWWRLDTRKHFTYGRSPRRVLVNAIRPGYATADRRHVQADRADGTPCQ